MVVDHLPNLFFGWETSSWLVYSAFHGWGIVSCRWESTVTPGLSQGSFHSRVCPGDFWIPCPEISLFLHLPRGLLGPNAPVSIQPWLHPQTEAFFLCFCNYKHQHFSLRGRSRGSDHNKLESTWEFRPEVIMDPPSPPSPPRLLKA